MRVPPQTKGETEMAHQMRRALVGALLVAGGLAIASPASGAGTVTNTNDAEALANAVANNADWIVGAELEASPPGGLTTALFTGQVGTLETDTGIILSTGDPARLTQPNDAPGSGDDFGGAAVRGDTDFDVTILRIDLEVPEGVNCLAGLDFTFLSEEFPEYVGTIFNDAFIVELDNSTWTTSGSEILAPDNFAFDLNGNTISINAAGVADMQPELAEGTTFDAATPVLRTASPITPGAHSLYLSIFDQGDRILDSAVVIDNLQLGTVVDVANDCKPGVVLADNPIVFDIKPDSDNNTLNPSAKGVLPTAILGSDTFDVSTIDTASLGLGPGKAPIAHKGGHLEDVNGDGVADLVLHFKIPLIDVSTDATELCVAGSTFDGDVVSACDSITLLGKKGKKG